jgi:hypothetical protein
MLTSSQANEIVRASIGKTVGERAVSANQKLKDAGITQDKFNAFVTTISADPTIGVPRFQHYLDPNVIAELDLTTTIEALTSKILELSAGKMCSNPHTPHPQNCCPYPTQCPQCGYAVL